MPGSALVLDDPPVADDVLVLDDPPVADDALVLGGSVATVVGRAPPPDVQDTVTRTATINAGAARI